MISSIYYKIIFILFSFGIISSFSYSENQNNKMKLLHNKNEYAFQSNYKLKALPKDYILIECNNQIIIKYYKRINNTLKENNLSPSVNYLKLLISKNINYENFLIEYHNHKIEEASILFLFKDEKVFECVYNYFSRNEDHNKIVRNIVHEKEHFDKALKNGVEVYYSLIINILSRTGKETKFNITPAVFPLIEKSAIEFNWSLNKYLKVSKELLNVHNMSKSDSLSIKTLEAIEKVWENEIK